MGHERSEWVLGVYSGHDGGACLLRDGAVAVMIEEERLTRFKHAIPRDLKGLWGRFRGRFGYFPWASLTYCLQSAGIGLDDLDGLAVSQNEVGDLGALIPLRDPSRLLVSELPSESAHHYYHALSGFFASPFERAAVLVVDGDGSRSAAGYEAESGYLFSDRSGACAEVFKNRYPEAGLRGGLGWAYEYVSAILGFVETRVEDLGQPGKTMGLAPYGDGTALSVPWLGVVGGKGFQLDFSAFHEWLQRSGQEKRLRFDTRELALIQEESWIPSEAADLAAKVQLELEAALMHLVRELHAATGADALCLAGGVHLNSVANGRIVREGPFKQVFIQPAASDCGQALGIAYEGARILAARRGEAPQISPMRHAYLGRSYPPEPIAALVRQAGLACEELEDDAVLCADAAQELAAGRFVGWFQGGSEVGPRALGHRSILADPRGDQVKDVLNARVKFREAFRPFAPSVLLERAAEVFELEGESPYMLQVVGVREPWAGQLPAVVHVDGTARVQTVSSDQCPLYHQLLSAFAAQTETPLVLNTSFNLRGMPIVESPEDALQCFLYTELDVLYLGRLKVRQPGLGGLRPRVRSGWRLVIEQRFSWGGPELEARYEPVEAGGGKPIEVGSAPETMVLCRLLNGTRTLREALREACGGGEPAPAHVKMAETLVRLLLRGGAFELCVGERTF